MRRGLCYSLLIGAGCIQPTAVPLPQGLPSELSAAALFASAGGQTQVLPFDLSAATSVPIAPGRDYELWAWACSPIELAGPPVAFVEPSLEAPRPDECAEHGAPCPALAFHFDPDAAEPWQELEARGQPWRGEPPSSCLQLDQQVLVQEILGLGRDGEPVFVLPLGEEWMVIGSRIGRDRDERPSGQLDLWRLPPGPPGAALPLLHTLTTSTAWLAAMAINADEALLIGKRGAVARLRSNGGVFELSRELSYPVDPVRCRSGTSTTVTQDKIAIAGGMTQAGLEVWISDGCGGVLKRVADGPWQVMREAGDWPDEHSGILWLGPDEVVIMGLTAAGLLHMVGREQTTESLPMPWPMQSLARSPSGKPIAAVYTDLTGALFERGPSGWTRWGPTFNEEVGVMLAVGDSMFMGGTRNNRLVQTRERGLCPIELEPFLIDDVLFRGVLMMNGHLVATARPTSGRDVRPSGYLIVLEPQGRLHCSELTQPAT